MSECNHDCENCAEECNHDCENCAEECNHDCENCGSECEHDCSHCSEHCGSRVIEPLKPLADVKIGKIIGVLSGKGGVGKSMVTGLLAVELARKGYKVGIMDADITGPSIPKMFGLGADLLGDQEGIFPCDSVILGIKAVSINMMLENEEAPVLWRGPIVGGVVKQFYTEVHWGELDYLLIDMPPGTSDVALSVFQEIPVDEIVMVTTPSKLVSMVVAKAINMAEQVKKPVVGMIENMAFIKCDKCGEEINIYKNDETQYFANRYGVEVLGKLPLDPDLANLADVGHIEVYEGEYLNKLVEKIVNEK